MDDCFLIGWVGGLGFYFLSSFCLHGKQTAPTNPTNKDIAKTKFVVLLFLNILIGRVFSVYYFFALPLFLLFFYLKNAKK